MSLLLLLKLLKRKKKAKKKKTNYLNDMRKYREVKISGYKRKANKVKEHFRRLDQFNEENNKKGIQKLFTKEGFKTIANPLGFKKKLKFAVENPEIFMLKSQLNEGGQGVIDVINAIGSAKPEVKTTLAIDEQTGTILKNIGYTLAGAIVLGAVIRLKAK